tara:strand:+ start:4753 stop:5430 length:678 start_codon:yes stop_codon:yes gene_type:complete
MYFGPEVDVAIIKYNKEEDPAIKSIIYQKEIKAAMEKLVENIIHTFKFYYTDSVPLEQVQHEVVSFLVEKLHKFDHTKGSKAFSYFSIVAKNFCILKNKKNYKKLIEHRRIDADLSIDIVAPEDEDKIDLNRFMEMYLLYWEDRVALYYKKEREQRLAEALLELFRKRDRIDIFNKKALYVYIREMTDANTQQITKVVKDMKVIYKKMFSHFLDKGFIDKDKIYR